MIASAKKDDPSVNFTNIPVEIPTIHFLTVNGTVHEEVFELSPYKQYVSKEKDFERYGKVETFNDKTLYYVKTFKGGRSGEVVPNPYSPFAKGEDLSTFNTKRGDRLAEYTQVSQRLFLTYQVFLRTRNDLYHRQVERDILNGDRMT